MNGEASSDVYTFEARLNCHRTAGTTPAWLALAVLLILISCIFLFFLPINDIGFSDETTYLVEGVDFFKAYPYINNGPLYSLWYFVLKQVVTDNYLLYFTSWCLLVVLCLTIPYLIERSRAAIVYAILACLMPFYVVWPYINLFSSALILVALSILETKIQKSYIVTCSVLLLTCSIMAFVRPEFRYACYPALVFLIAAIVLEGKARSHLPLLALCVATFIIVESLFASLADTRSGPAFAGHHDVISFEQGKLNENPWTARNAYKLFGLTQDATLLDFLRANPHEFWSHIVYDITRPLFIGLICLGALTLAISTVRMKPAPSISIANISLYRMIPLSLLYLPSIATTAIFYPRNHYFVIPYLVSAYYIARSELFVSFTRYRAALALLLILACASISANYWVKLSKLPPYQLKWTIKCLISLQTQRGINHGAILDTLEGVNAYLNGDIRSILHYAIKDNESFDTFLLRNNPVIVITDQNLFEYMTLKGHSSVSSLADLNELVRQRGYEEYHCPHPGPAIFYKY